MIPTTVGRVPGNTDHNVNAQIRRQTNENVAKYSIAHPDRIERRLEQLDSEWDIERTLEANAAAVALVGFGLGSLVDRRFFALPAIVATFLMQHAVQGWCPPLPLFRRMGVRTQAEIEEERYALKALRGDFAGVRAEPRHNEVSMVSNALSAVRR